MPFRIFAEGVAHHLPDPRDQSVTMGAIFRDLSTIGSDGTPITEGFMGSLPDLGFTPSVLSMGLRDVGVIEGPPSAPPAAVSLLAGAGPHLGPPGLARPP